MTRKIYTRRVKKKAHPAVSCHDLYTSGDRERKDMCRNCINYLDFNPKLKPQHEMGRRHYMCSGPENVVCQESIPQESIEVANERDEAKRATITPASNDTVAHCNRNKRLRLFQTPNSAHGTPIGTSDVDQNVELNLLKAKFRALAEKLETKENELSACKSQLKETKEEKFNQEKNMKIAWLPNAQMQRKKSERYPFNFKWSTAQGFPSKRSWKCS
jgi:hypothetical protein